MTERAPEVRILADAAAAVPILLEQVRSLREAPTRQVLGLATGSTFAAFLSALGGELTGDGGAGPVLASHLDEYLGFLPDQPSGMVHELTTACPALAAMLPRGLFLPVPGDGSDAALRAHEQRLQRAGGVGLQLLGIGRNGHLAFNEPGTPFDRGFHVATLAASTRDDARARFAPAEPPAQAVTAGVASILAARRLVLCAFGKAKAAAVAAMLRGPITPACPASAVRQHGDVLVLLDRAAAAGLGAPGSAG